MVRWMVVNCWFAYSVFLIAVRGFGLGSEMTWTLPTRNPVIPLLRATIIRDARSYSFWPFLSNFSSLIINTCHDHIKSYP